MPLKYLERETTVKVCVGFQCSRCGAEYDCEDDVFEIQEKLRWKNTGGYGSVWGDGTTVEVDLCQKCTYELFKDFATVHDT